MQGFLDDNRNLGVIFFVAVLLALSVAVDYASDDSIKNIDSSFTEINDSSIHIVNSSSYVAENDNGAYFVASNRDKMYTVKGKKKKKANVVKKVKKKKKK